jgi:hypothetical protein
MDTKQTDKTGVSKMLKLIVGLTICALSGSVLGQRQVILMAGDEVVHRFKKGDSFRIKLVGDKTEHWGFLVEINEFSVITSQDTIDLREIRKVLLPGKPLAHKIGVTLITVGVGLFVIDQLNYTLVQGNDPNIDSGIAKASITLVATGLPLLLIRKNWAKTKGGLKLISVDRDSRFYLPDYN